MSCLGFARALGLAAACPLLLAHAAEDGDLPTNTKAPGYRVMWYGCNGLDEEYKWKYSGALGVYCAKHIPLGVYAPEVDKTFFVYGGTDEENSTLLAMASCYDHRTGAVPRPTVIMDKKTRDAHDNPVMSIDGAGYLWVFVSAHGRARPAYTFRSAKPYDADAFELTDTTNYSYPQPWHFPGRGFLFLQTRYSEKGERVLYWQRSPDGAEWSEPETLAHIDHGHYQVSWRQADKAGTAFNYHPAAFQGDGGKRGLNYRTNLYYLETRDMGETWSTAAGRKVSLPVDRADHPARVHDYEAEGRLVYLKDINFDAEGNPVILHLTSRGWHPAPENGPRTWRVAHWRDGAWRFSVITTSDHNYDTGAIHVLDDGSWRVVAPTATGPQQFCAGGEVMLWASRDQGASWRLERRMTANSPHNHTYCRRIVNAHPGFVSLWADGHGRELSVGRFHFCDLAGNVYRLPVEMRGAEAVPE